MSLQFQKKKMKTDAYKTFFVQMVQVLPFEFLHKESYFFNK
jgi:hypothetical protein